MVEYARGKNFSFTIPRSPFQRQKPRDACNLCTPFIGDGVRSLLSALNAPSERTRKPRTAQEVTAQVCAKNQSAMSEASNSLADEEKGHIFEKPEIQNIDVCKTRRNSRVQKGERV